MKYSRALAGIVLAALLIAPAGASALSFDELNQQIATLLSQVAVLQQKIAAQSQSAPSVAATGTIAVSATSTPAQTSAMLCPQLSRALSMGVRGDDVRSLQNYLSSQKMLDPDNATGYFGALTQRAVQKWQSAHGVVTSGDPSTTGFGAVGARTRSLMALNCSAGRTTDLGTLDPAASAGFCPAAPPPIEICSSGWQANTDANGCTMSYRCTTVLPTVTPASSNKCVLYSLPTCAAGDVIRGGTLDTRGCAGPAHCVASTTAAL